jgi:hypothetical protein
MKQNFTVRQGAPDGGSDAADKPESTEPILMKGEPDPAKEADAQATRPKLELEPSKVARHSRISP